MNAYNLKSKGHAKCDAVFAPFVKDEMGRLVHHSQNAIRTKQLNMWAGYNRIQPMSALVSGVLASQQIDFQYGSHLARGYLVEFLLEITITENNTDNSIFNPYNLWNHIDVVDSKGDIYKQIWPDEMFLGNVLYRDLETHQHARYTEGLQADYTPDSPTVAQNTSRQFILHFPVFRNLLCDFRLLRSPLQLRFYFNKASDIVMSSSSANISLTNFNLLAKEVLLPSVRYNSPLTFKYANWVRNVRGIDMLPSNVYNIKLDSFTNYAKFLLFVIRPAPTQSNGNNLYNYAPGSHLQSFELRDSGNNIIGVNVNVQESKYIFNKDFNSDFLIQPNTYVHIINFSLDGNIDQNLSTHMGGYQMTSNEFLYLNTASTLVGAAYEVTIWSVNHDIFQIGPDGDFNATK